MTYSEGITQDYLEKLRTLDLPMREPKSSMILHMYGDGIRASSKFNFQVYSGKGGLKLVTNDKHTLDRLLRGEIPDTKGKRIISIDDSGWGCPVGGVLCGLYDEETGRFTLREVEVEYFQEQRFHTKEYLDRFKVRALEMVDKVRPSPSETAIRICTGYVNTRAKDALREQQFHLVEVDEIGEPLQSWLEEKNTEYVNKLLGEDLYYDPKMLSESEIARKYNQMVQFVKQRNLMHVAKTGWKSFQGGRQIS